MSRDSSLAIPDFSGLCYSLQFNDPSTGTRFANMGKRTTGTRTGDFVITGPGWKGSFPQGMQRIISPNRSVMVIGRTQITSGSDMATAYNLSKRI